MNTKTGGKPSITAMFSIMDGWTTQFDVLGQKVGGNMCGLTNDPRLIWHMENIGGVKDKSILELGALEGAHTKMMLEHGAREVVAIEGLSDCFLRCLIVKEAFQMDRATFMFCDFCEYVKEYNGEPFDAVSASGVLYHQKNPAELLHNISKITNTVFGWSQVASSTQPSLIESTVESNGFSYKGKINNYNGSRLTLESYCGGLNNEAFWMYRQSLIQCLYDAGFNKIITTESPTNLNGETLMFVATKL